MTGGPWHCGHPMVPRGGNQVAGPNDWVAWRCASCGHQQTIFGRLEGPPEKFVPAQLPVLTVMMCNIPTGVLCRGLCRDEWVFQNLTYVNSSVAMDAISRFYQQRGFRCVFNLPKENKR